MNNDIFFWPRFDFNDVTLAEEDLYSKLDEHPPACAQADMTLFNQ